MMKSRAALSALLVLFLGACATVQRYDAAGDIHAFLIAIRDNDRAGFEAHVDRPALKAQLHARLLAAAMERPGAQALIAAVGERLLGGLVDSGLDELIQPQVLLAVAEANGYSPSKPLPNRVSISAAIKPLEGDRVCVVAKRDGPCVLVFRNEANVWRLTAFEGPANLLRPGKLKAGLIP
jgi:hypothetical protein